jgi:hypothetical protein
LNSLQTADFIFYTILLIITDGKIEQVPFDDEEVQAVFNAQVENEGFQQNALALINDNASIPETIDKDAFISPKPLPSWTLNADTLKWEAPIPKPAGPAAWDEISQVWNTPDVV